MPFLKCDCGDALFLRYYDSLKISFPCPKCGSPINFDPADRPTIPETVQPAPQPVQPAPQPLLKIHIKNPYRN